MNGVLKRDVAQTPQNGARKGTTAVSRRVPPVKEKTLTPSLKEGATKQALEKAMVADVLEKAELIGLYKK